MPERNHSPMLLVVAAVVVAIDQLSKALVVSAIGPGRAESRVDLIGQWLVLEYAENRGVAFGLFAGVGWLVPLASLIIVAVLLGRHLRTPVVTPLQTLAVGAILGGAIGNLSDRLRLGYVVDFIAVGAWPNFNVADGAITIGVGLMIWTWFSNDAERNTVWT